MGGKKYIVR